MAKFKIGERARVVRADPGFGLLGKECTIEALIETPLFDYVNNEQWYSVTIDGRPSSDKTGRWIGAESCFEKLVPSGRRLFEECMNGPDLVKGERKQNQYGTFHEFGTKRFKEKV